MSGSGFWSQGLDDLIGRADLRKTDLTPVNEQLWFMDVPAEAMYFVSRTSDFSPDLLAMMYANPCRRPLDFLVHGNACVLPHPSLSALMWIPKG